MKQCSIEDCEAEHYARGWCNRHYKRWWKHGDPLTTQAYRTDPEEGFLCRTEPLVWSSCVVWTGPLESSGYGRISVNGRVVPVHRYAWERERGPIPDGMLVDHRCFERSCVEVSHLRLATPRQNQQNRSGANAGRKHDLPRGVTRNGRGYAARIVLNGAKHYLGTFGTVEEASAAAAEGRRIHFGIYAGRA